VIGQWLDRKDFLNKWSELAFTGRTLCLELHTVDPAAVYIDKSQQATDLKLYTKW